MYWVNGGLWCVFTLECSVTWAGRRVVMNGCHGNGESRCRMLGSIDALAACAKADNDANVTRVCWRKSRYTQCQQKPLMRNIFLLILLLLVVVVSSYTGFVFVPTSCLTVSGILIQVHARTRLNSSWEIKLLFIIKWGADYAIPVRLCCCVAFEEMNMGWPHSLLPTYPPPHSHPMNVFIYSFIFKPHVT